MDDSTKGKYYSRITSCDRVSPVVDVTLMMLDHGPATTIEGVYCSHRAGDLKCRDASNSCSGGCVYLAPNLARP